MSEFIAYQKSQNLKYECGLQNIFDICYMKNLIFKWLN